MESSIGLTRANRTMFKSKKALVCMAKFSSRRLDWLREMLPFEPGVLIFRTERISHHAPKENTKIKIPLHKKSREKTATLRSDKCNVDRENREATYVPKQKPTQVAWRQIACCT